MPYIYTYFIRNFVFKQYTWLPIHGIKFRKTKTTYMHVYTICSIWYSIGLANQNGLHQMVAHVRVEDQHPNGLTKW